MAPPCRAFRRAAPRPDGDGGSGRTRLRKAFGSGYRVERGAAVTDRSISAGPWARSSRPDAPRIRDRSRAVPHRARRTAERGKRRAGRAGADDLVTAEPRLPRLRRMSGPLVFLSDAHLGAQSPEDEAAREAKLHRFLRHLPGAT